MGVHDYYDYDGVDGMKMQHPLVRLSASNQLFLIRRSTPELQ